VKNRGRVENLTRAGKGKPKGTPNHATREIREAARALVEDAAYVVNLQRRLREGSAAHMETLLHHYAYGRPKETVAHEGISLADLILGNPRDDSE
jgi:hypothetical protein